MDKQLITQQLNSCPVSWQAQLNPDLIAIQLDNREISFIELHRYINTLTLQLLALNMQKGDRLVCIAANGLQLVLLQLACIRNGFIFCSINPKFSETEIQQRITLLDSPFIWQANGSSKITLEFELSHQPHPLTQRISIDPQAIISIIFTSGSSGTPKAVMHNFESHYFSALGSQSVIPLQAMDKNLLSLPLFHISGYATVIRTILAGATLQISNQKVNVEYLKKAQTTHLSLVSSQLQTLLSEPLFKRTLLTIKHLLLGGSAFPSKILQRTMQRGFTYHLSYGSTEMASQIATSSNNEQLKILPYRKLRVINGEIQVAGETRFSGYFKAASEGNLTDKNSYFSTSDLGEIKNDVINILGRKDRQFISGGENIQPEEIEKVLLTFPNVLQAYVLPIEDARFGQRPIAFIQWDNFEQPTQLKAFLKNKLIAFKHPLHYLPFPEQQGIKVNAKQLTDVALKLLFIN